MPVTCREEGRNLVAMVSGELDHHEAKAVMEELEARIDQALSLIHISARRQPR